MAWQNLPEELKALAQWVGANDNKIPLDPKTGKNASVTEPSTWGTFEQACNCGSPHIGFVFTEQDPYVFIDLDTGKVPDHVDLHNNIIEQAESYTETSKSGAGYHIILRGKLDHGARDDLKGLEIYPHGRYMLATGWSQSTNQIVDGQELLDYLVDKINTKRFDTSNLSTVESTKSDEDIYNTICQAANGEKFKALFNDEWMAYPEYQSDHSRADLALAIFLDFYTKDVDQVLRMFKLSKLYRPEKGRASTDGSDYILRTIKQARARNDADIPPMVDMSILRQRAAEVIQAKTDRQVTETKLREIEFPPGLVGDIANYIYTSAIRPVREVALMGALAITAGMVGRQFNISGSGLNLYLILLAPTGTGKEGAGSGISNLLKQVRVKVPGVDQFVGPAEFASGPALIKKLDDQPCLFSILGEFGLRMQAMADVRSNGAERTLQRALLNLYSKSGWHQSESSTVYSDKEKNTKTLFAPALTIFGESTPETFFQGLSEQQVSSGLLPRFLFLEYIGDRPPRNRVSAFCEPDPALVSNVANLAETAMQMQANNSCHTIVINTQAQSLLDQFDTYCDEMINKGKEVYKQLWNRAHLKALRLSGVIAVGVNTMKPVVTEELATWAISFVQVDILTLVGRFSRDEIGDGEHRYEAEIRKAVEYYLSIDAEKRKAFKVPKTIIDKPIIPYSYLRRRLRTLSGFKNDRRGVTYAIQGALRDLCEAGILQLISPVLRKDQYGINSDVYVLGEHW